MSSNPSESAPAKLVLLIRRREGMSVEAFRDYYETRHAPLVLRLIGRHMTGYRRSYVREDDPLTVYRDPASTDRFDVVTEVRFADRAALDATYAGITPDIARQIGEDEARFMDQGSVRRMVVDECG